MPRSTGLVRALLALGGLAACREPAPPPAPDETVAVQVAPFETAPAMPAAPLRVLVGGDLLPHRPSLAAPGALASALTPMGPLFAGADAVLANYETATGEVAPHAPRLVYGAPPEWLGAAAASGIDALTVANNHACDLGEAGLDATLAAADASNVVALGADAAGDAWQPRVIAERAGKRICAVAWTMLVNDTRRCSRSPRLAVATNDAAGRRGIARALERARATCDATVAIVHGGEEYVRQTPAIVAMARHAAESGADAVVLHHPHVPSPVLVHEARDGRAVPLFASVGNLVSNQGESWTPAMPATSRENHRLVCVNGWTRLGVVADLAFSFEPAPRLDWGYHLVWTENEHAADRTIAVPRITTRPLDPDGDAAIVARLAQDERGPTELFDDPCWVERPSADAARPTSSRCTTSLVRSAPAPTGPVARARKHR